MRTLDRAGDKDLDTLSQLESVVEAFDRLGVEVRRANLGGSGGGLCRIRGRPVVFIDLDADPATQLQCTVQALTALPNAETVFLAPNLRELMDNERSRSE